MTTEELQEKIARAIRLADTGDSLPPGFAARMWDEGVTNRDKEMRIAAAVLPVVRAAQAEAWDEGHETGWGDACAESEMTGLIGEWWKATVTPTPNPHRDKEPAP